MFSSKEIKSIITASGDCKKILQHVIGTANLMWKKRSMEDDFSLFMLQWQTEPNVKMDPLAEPAKFAMNRYAH